MKNHKKIVKAVGQDAGGGFIYRATFDRRKMKITILGKLNTAGKAHSVIVYDECPPNQLDYWRKTYVDEVRPDGTFEVEVNEPTGQNGAFKFVFCFDNGVVTGNGQDCLIANGYERKYQFAGYRFTLLEE